MILEKSRIEQTWEELSERWEADKADVLEGIRASGASSHISV